MKYLEDSRLTQLTFDLTGAFLNTRGSKSSGGSPPAGPVGVGRNHRGKNKNNNKSPSPRHAPSPNRSHYAYNRLYNPAGYSTYNENGSSSSAGSSSRAIYGRVEAYTTKRAGSDKQTAFEVGERYAAEMERLNEAVETLKERRRRHIKEEQSKREKDGAREGDDGGGGEKGTERRRRSRSVDGVTFAPSAAVVCTEPVLAPLEEGVVEVIDLTEDREETNASPRANKRHLPLEGILKRPSLSTNGKRLRAASFDVSTGPSTLAASSRAWVDFDARENHNNMLPLSIVHPTIEEDRRTCPLIPQPSLYQSSIGIEQSTETADRRGSPTMVPRRLVTDLILTLNASFPDYDFSDAQVSDFCTLSTPEAMRRINESLGEFAATTDAGRDFLPRFWGSIEDVLFGDLKDCEVYSYGGRSTGEDDPLEFLTRSMANDDDEANEGVLEGATDRVAAANGLAGGGRIVSDELNANMALDLVHQVSPSSRGDRPPHVTLWSMNYFFVSKNKKRIVMFACVQTVRTPQGDAEDCDFGEGNQDGYGENNIVFEEARREKVDRGYDSASFPSSTQSDNTEVASRSNYMVSELCVSPAGDESVGVMVEDTDFEEEVDVAHVDGDEVHVHNDFDTGTLSVPSQVA